MLEREFQYILDLVKDKCDDVEVLGSGQKSLNIRIQKGEIESFDYSLKQGLGVRVIKDGKTGYAYSEDLSEEALSAMVQLAIDNSIYCEDAIKPIIASFDNTIPVLDLYNPELQKITVEEKIRFLTELEKQAYASDARVENVSYCSYNDGDYTRRVVNTKGVCKEFQVNSANCYIGVIVSENGEKRSYYDYCSGRDFSKFNAKELAQRVVEKAIALLGGKSFERGNYPVVFTPDTMTSILACFMSVFCADEVIENRSLLRDKIGQQVAAANVTIVDDALDPTGFGTEPFDCEGACSMQTVLVQNGNLVSYLHNSTTANHMNVKTTANASRGFKGSLGIAHSNLKLVPGTYSRNDLFNSYKQVIEIVSLAGMHSGTNAISGDFSLSCEGFMYEDGKCTGSLQQFTVSGNFLEMLQNIEKIAEDFKYDYSAVGSASVLIKSLSFSS